MLRPNRRRAATVTTFAKRYTAIHERSSELSSAKLFRFAVVGSTKNQPSSSAAAIS